MRVLHLVPSLRGGAGRAALRIHRSLEAGSRDSLVHSAIRCLVSPIAEAVIEAGYPSRLRRFLTQSQERLAALSGFGFRADPGIHHSVAAAGIALPRAINASGVDLVHLHACGDHLLSIEDIGRIRRPLVWTLHDQWAFCGAEHYASLSSTRGERFREGYSSANRHRDERGPDLNRRTWERKRRSWLQPFPIVAPSRWLADGVRQSSLMRGWPAEVIPHPIDCSRWRPLDRRLARQELGLPQDRTIVLFGVDNGCTKPLKGADLLIEALHLVLQMSPPSAPLLLAVFGQQLSPAQQQGLPYQYLGRFDDDVRLQLAYAACDLLAMPSRKESFGLTAAEAQTCGIPVVAFAHSGLLDVVDHQLTGALAEPFDPRSLAHWILWVLDDEDRRHQLGRSAREKALRCWTEPVVASQYRDLYRRVLSSAGFHNPMAAPTASGRNAT